MNNKIFVSYHHDEEDNYYKWLLVAWSKNHNGYFDIKFQDESVGVSINSEDAKYIKSVISDRISSSGRFLCIVGKNTYKSDWVNWEIDKAVELGKPVVAIKLNNSNTTPIPLYGINAEWAREFNYEAIKKALDNVYYR